MLHKQSALGKSVRGIDCCEVLWLEYDLYVKGVVCGSFKLLQLAYKSE